jgi:predicted transcriptional regulator
MEISVKELELAKVRRGEWETAELLGFARQFVAEPPQVDALYDGLRAKVGHLLRIASSAEEMAEWRNAIARVIALALDCAPKSEPHPSMELAVRLGVLRDLSADSVAQEAFYGTDRLRDQPHFKKCLELLESNHGEMTRAKLLTDLGLKESNGTRVLKVLEGARLIRRHRESGAVRVRLTQDGRKALLQWRSPPASPNGAKLHVDGGSGAIPGVPRQDWEASMAGTSAR